MLKILLIFKLFKSRFRFARAVFEIDDGSQRHVGEFGTVEHGMEFMALRTLLNGPVFIQGLV